MSETNPTIYDIAKLAKTSAASVSRVLSNSGYPVKEELRKKIISIAKEIDYTPNLLGRQLKTNKSNDIGIIIPNITNQFYPLLLSGVESVAREKGYNVFLCNSLRNPENEKKYLTSLFQKMVKGVIISSITGNHEYLQQLQHRGLQVVAFDQGIDINCNKISFKFYQGGYMAAEHFLKQGHRRIAFLSAPLTRYSRIKIYNGFMDCLRDNLIQEAEKYLFVAKDEKESFKQIYEFENGKQLVRKMLHNYDSLPTAVFCINDMTAFGVIQELNANKMYVPKDMAVMGFDNIPTSEVITPSLTTIDQSADRMGALAAEMLCRKIENPEEEKEEITLYPELVVRDSTRRV